MIMIEGLQSFLHHPMKLCSAFARVQVINALSGPIVTFTVDVTPI